MCDEKCLEGANEIDQRKIWTVFELRKLNQKDCLAKICSIKYSAIWLAVRHLTRETTTKIQTQKTGNITKQNQ